MADVLQIGANVATPLGVVGLVVTALLLAYYRRLKHQEKQLQSLPEEKRSQAVDTLLSRYGIDAANLTREQKYDLIRAEMDRRAENLKLCVIVSAVVFVFCFALGTVAYVAKANQAPQSVPPVIDHRPPNPSPDPDLPKAKPADTKEIKVTLPKGLLGSGEAEEKLGPTRAKGDYQIIVEDGRVRIIIQFDVRQSGVSGTGRGSVFIQLLDNAGSKVFGEARSLTVGSNSLKGTASKDLREEFTVAGTQATPLGSKGLVVAFGVTADGDKTYLPASAMEWAQAVGKEPNEVIAGLKPGQEVRLKNWIFKRLAE